MEILIKNFLIFLFINRNLKENSVFLCYDKQCVMSVSGYCLYSCRVFANPAQAVVLEPILIFNMAGKV